VIAYSPYGSLIRDWQGNLYGAASNGGNTKSSFCNDTVEALADALGCGTVSKIDHAGNFSVLHTKCPGLVPKAGIAPVFLDIIAGCSELRSQNFSGMGSMRRAFQ
jgi:hypothetical protein